jgi:hypothetical protein
MENHDASLKWDIPTLKFIDHNFSSKAEET